MSQPETNKFGRGKSYKGDSFSGSTFYKTGTGENERKRERSRFQGNSHHHEKGRNAPSDINPPTILLKTRATETRSLSPVSLKSQLTEQHVKESVHVSQVKDSGNVVSPMVAPVSFLNSDLLFQDSLADFLGDNSDFLVIGFAGLQWTGKSTIVSHLASSSCNEFSDKTVFKISTSELQIKGETATYGLDAYISAERIIWLDCQPILSAAIADKELVASYSKDNYKETLSKIETNCVGTLVEVQSLQLLAYLYCICHTLVVVQDSLVDPNLIRLLQTAEMLKPNLTNDDSAVDCMPHLITIYNHAQPSDLVPETLKRTVKFYRQTFAKSQLEVCSNLVYTNKFLPLFDSQGVNYVVLPNWNVNNIMFYTYEQTIPYLKRALLALPRRTFGPPGMTEKSWFVYANKAWEAVRKSSLMMEYARLLQ